MQRTEPPASSMAPTATAIGVAEPPMARSWAWSSARIARADSASIRPLPPVSSIALPANWRTCAGDKSMTVRPVSSTRRRTCARRTGSGIADRPIIANSVPMHIRTLV